jgi:flagellar protein FliO/FliZ
VTLLPLPTAAAVPRGLALVGGGALVLLAAVSAGELGRGVALATALTGLGVALLFARQGRAPATRPALLVTERHALGRDSGLALVSVRDRRLLVGFGAAGVTLVAELQAAPSGGDGGDLP